MIKPQARVRCRGVLQPGYQLPQWLRSHGSTCKDFPSLFTTGVGLGEIFSTLVSFCCWLTTTGGQPTTKWSTSRHWWADNRKLFPLTCASSNYWLYCLFLLCFFYRILPFVFFIFWCFFLFLECSLFHLSRHDSRHHHLPGSWREGQVDFFFLFPKKIKRTRMRKEYWYLIWTLNK